MTSFQIVKKCFSLERNSKKLLFLLIVFVMSTIVYIFPENIYYSTTEIVKNLNAIVYDKNSNEEIINSFNSTEHKVTEKNLTPIVLDKTANSIRVIIEKFILHSNTVLNSTKATTNNIKTRKYQIIKNFTSNLYRNDLQNFTTRVTPNNFTDIPKNNVTKFIYVLQWTHGILGSKEGNGEFIEKGCEYTNCYVTNRRDYLGDYTKFDVIIFYTPHVFGLHNSELPQIRLPHQKYIFGSLESSAYYPICSNQYDNFFNWTWSFRLDSDARWVYMNIRNMNGTIIGPKQDMHWIKLEDMDPVPKKLRIKLSSKKKLVAWVVSNCHSKNKRELFVLKLNKELKKYGYEVDIFGACGSKKCQACEDMTSKEYFFYLSFENSFNEDYVTEKILRGLQYNTVPVVYGGANYTRFMPDGIYLNAIELGVKKLATKMIEISKDFEKYVEFFKWRNHYSYEPTDLLGKPDGNDYCKLCAMLNDKNRMKEYSVVNDFREWWDPPNWC